MSPRKKKVDHTFNLKVAAIFRRFAEVLRVQDGNPFRINAYLRAAAMLESLDEDTREILKRKGVAALVDLPTIGEGLASSIDEIARTGTLSQLERLEGAAEPETLFRSVPGIGPELSRRIHDTLHIDTLEALELAAHDGRLASVPGIGQRRLAGIRSSLESILGRRQARSRANLARPPIQTVLDVDQEYLQKALAGKLPQLAPKRFNPTREAWLPVLHTERGNWRFTALFSNTARAHELGCTHDWVVIYYYDDDHREGQCTVVTETHGALKGRRVVRGREAEMR